MPTEVITWSGLTSSVARRYCVRDDCKWWQLCSYSHKGLKTQARKDLDEAGISFILQLIDLGKKGRKKGSFQALKPFFRASLLSSSIQLLLLSSCQFYLLICHLHFDFNKYDCLRGKRQVRKRYSLCSRSHLGERPRAQYYHILSRLSYRITSGDYTQPKLVEDIPAHCRRAGLDDL